MPQLDLNISFGTLVFVVVYFVFFYVFWVGYFLPTIYRAIKLRKFLEQEKRELRIIAREARVSFEEAMEREEVLILEVVNEIKNNA